MLFRKRINDLIHWRDNENGALLIDGARQVGKTYLIKEFIKSFDKAIDIDFTKNAQALSLLLEVRDYDDFVNRLSILSPVKLVGGNAVLFLDEIQYYYEVRAKRIEANPQFEEKYIDILTLAKDIVAKGDFRLILSGSLLGTTLFRVNLNPMGSLRKIRMYPMDFEEFLLAHKVAPALIEEARNCFLQKRVVSESLNDFFLEKFKEYLFVGGFPKAVEGYLLDPTLDKTSIALGEIDDWYRGDILKYAAVEDRLVILNMYEILPSEITMKNKKFVKSHLDVPNFKNIDLKDRFLWLKTAGIAIPTYNVTNAKYPLKISEDSKIVKLFLGDTGLLTHLLFDREAKRKLMLDSKGTDLGAVFENAVAELLVAHGYPPYFQSTKKRGEVDFIIEKNMSVIPIEIKSFALNKPEANYSHPALDHLLEDHSEIKEAWVFGMHNVRWESERVCQFPIYMIDFVAKE